VGTYMERTRRSLRTGPATREAAWTFFFFFFFFFFDDDKASLSIDGICLDALVDFDGGISDRWY
jgi:hypothetical protein